MMKAIGKIKNKMEDLIRSQSSKLNSVLGLKLKVGGIPETSNLQLQTVLTDLIALIVS